MRSDKRYMCKFVLFLNFLFKPDVMVRQTETCSWRVLHKHTAVLNGDLNEGLLII
jgi:hypothetical protein